MFLYFSSIIATIQISTDGKWITAGAFEPGERDIAKGIGGRGLFEYDADFARSHLDSVSAWRVGLCYPVNFELYKSAGWPAFLLDILPSGAGRRVWVRRLGLKNNETADWQLLLNGAGNPPGNLRVAESVIPPAESHPGFTEEEIIQKEADFIEYAEARGAVVAGATDVAGNAPKFLLPRIQMHRRQGHYSSAIRKRWRNSPKPCGNAG